MKPIVNQETCIGCGSCEATCPQVFHLENGKSQVIAGVDYAKEKAGIDEAIKICPVQAISWEK
jgi:ferredoxin